MADEQKIFTQALDHASGLDRDAFLNQACEGDSVLLRQVSELMAIYEESNDENFLEPCGPTLFFDSSEAEVADAVCEGRKIGDYQILERVGRGGTADVYRALQISLNREVAVKMMRGPSEFTGRELGRFRREAISAGKLDHPNIVPVYDVGEEEGEVFFSMRLLSGGSLAAADDAEVKPAKQTVALLIKIAKAVSFAHRNGIIHRDLKPSNILLDDEGEPYVADFGLAKSLNSSTIHSLAGHVTGTPGYMAPEQIAGEKSSTTLIDVYSLGAILYELLTGQMPFAGDSVVGILENVRLGKLIPPAQLSDNVDRDLETIVLKSMDSEPAGRYRSVDQLIDDLQRWMNGEPILARSVSVFERAWRWRKRNPLGASLAAAVTLLLLVILIGGPLVAWRQSYLNSRMKGILYASEMRQACELVEQADGLTQIVHILTRWEKRGLVGDRSLRGWEWDYLSDQVEKPVAVIQTGVSDMDQLVWYPDASQIVSGSSRHGGLLVWDVATGAKRKTVQVPRLGQLGWSEGGKLLEGVARAGGWFQWDPVTSKIERGTPAAKLDFSNKGKPTWDPARRRLAYFDSKLSKTCVWDKDTEKRLVVLDDTRFTNQIVWSPGGQYLVVSGNYMGVKLWSALDGSVRSLLPGGGRSDHTKMAWSPSGKRLAVVELGGKVEILEMPSGEKVAKLVGDFGAIAALAWHPDGEILASVGADRAIRIWNVQSGEQREVIPAHSQRVTSLAWSGDGVRLASGSVAGTIKIWKMHSGPRNRVQVPIVNRTGVAAWSGDGRKIVVKGSSKKHALQLWDLDTRKWTPLREVKGWVNALNWSSATDRLLIGFANAKPVEMWDMAGKAVREEGLEFETPQAYRSAVWNPKADAFAVTMGNVVKVYSYLNGESFDLVGHKKQAMEVSWSPDGKRLASVSRDRTARIWDVSRKKQLLKIAWGTQFQTVEWSPDGDKIAVSAEDFNIRVFDAKSGKRDFTLRRGHTRRIRSLSWSLDGSRLASCGDDRSIRLWDTKTRRMVAVLKVHEKPVLLVCWSPDGKRLLSLGEDQMIIWGKP
ncbi:MAG: protein kinase [Verrucomicrobiales bacterium]|nr:protein kinase [Verrucomicrobiales bacterium]